MKLNVFINCPFDNDYKNLFNAIVFTVFDCGYIPRCALEVINAGQVRIDKIVSIISESDFGIHDISRTELDCVHNLPRFNMPFELGLFMGAQKFGNKSQKVKNCLIIDKDRYRYQKYISDIAGQDIYSHDNSEETIIRLVSNWLRNANQNILMPGGNEILKRYQIFSEDLPEMCAKVKLSEDEISFNDFRLFVSSWLKINEIF